jgi:hypothetical protein
MPQCLQNIYYVRWGRWCLGYGTTIPKNRSNDSSSDGDHSGRSNRSYNDHVNGPTSIRELWVLWMCLCIDMNTKTLLMLPLLLLVAITPAMVHADKVNCGDTQCDESGEYSSCMTPDADCSVGADICSNEVTADVHNITGGYYRSIDLGHVSNQTACIDGFVNGWNKMCDPVKAMRAENPQRCPTNFYNELDINTVATYDNGVQHLYISHYEHVKPSKHNLADVIQSRLLNNTWNIVNTTNMDAMSMDNMGNMNTNAVSGTITFSSSTIGEGVYTENINGHIIQGVWNVGNVVGIPGVDLCPMANNICEALHYKTGDFTNHIKFTDEHGRTIHLMK